jgi:hypothetical protein
MAYVTESAATRSRYLLPSLPEIVIQIGTEPPHLQLHQDYISRYIWHETQMPGSQHLHDIVSLNHRDRSETPDLPEPSPEPPCLSDNAVNTLGDTMYALDLPDLVSEDSTE